MPQLEATMTARRFVLHFTGAEQPELSRTDFHHPQYAPRGRSAVRGKDEGAYPGAGSFQWSPVVKVLIAYLLRCAAWGRLPSRHGECPFLEGGPGTPAASLNWALGKKLQWMCEMFG